MTFNNTTSTTSKNNSITSIDSIMNTSITLPLLSALPSSTTNQLTQSILKQCWAEYTIRDFFQLVIHKRRRRRRRKKGLGSSVEGEGEGLNKKEERSITSSSETRRRKLNGDNVEEEGEGMELTNTTSSSSTTTTNLYNNSNPTSRRSVHTAKTHFLFRNLHSNNLTIRQSCIMTLMQAIEEEDDDDEHHNYHNDFSDSGEEEVGGKNQMEIHGSTQQQQPQAPSIPTTTASSKIIKWNYKLILRNVVWDLIQDDFHSFLHSAFLNIFSNGNIGSCNSANSDFDPANQIASTPSVSSFMNFGSGNSSDTTTTNTAGTTTNATNGKKGIVQLVALFMYLLEDCEDDDNLLYTRSYFKKEKKKDDNNVNEDGKKSSTTATLTPSKNDHDMKEDDEDNIDHNTNDDNHIIIDNDGRSAFYHFIIKGGLKWISQMIHQLIQVLLSLNNVNYLSSSTAATATTTYPTNSIPTPTSPQLNKATNSTYGENEDDNNYDENEENPLSTFQFTSPSTLNKPRHYFHSLKQSSNAIMLSNPLFEEEILIRLSLLVDVFMRISLVGYLYPQKQPQEEEVQPGKNDDERGENGKIETSNASSSNHAKAATNTSTFLSLPNRSRYSKRLQNINNTNLSSNNQGRNVTGGDVEMANVDDVHNQQQNSENSKQDAISNFLNALNNLESNIGTPISIIDNEKSNTPSSMALTTSCSKMKMKSDQERQNRRVQVLQTIRHYIWQQSNIDSSSLSSADASILQVPSKNESSLKYQSEVNHLSPLASLITASFVLSTTTPPPTPTSPSGSSSLLAGRSSHSLSFLTSTLMSGMLSSGSRLRSANGGSNSANSNSAEKISLFSDDYPILPGSIRTERVISYLNKLIDPNQDAIVILKAKDADSSIQSKKKNTSNNEHSLSEKRKKLAALKNRKRKSLNDSAGSNSGLPNTLESNLALSGGKRRRLAPSDVISSQGLSSGGGSNLPEHGEEEEMSSSTARAILRAVVVGDRAAERGTLVRETSNPFSFSIERGSRDSVTELMARDMMESLLERRSSNNNVSSRSEGRVLSNIRSSSLDDSGFMRVDILERSNNGDNENKNNEDGEVRDGNDENEADDKHESEDFEDEDEDQDEECVEDDEAHGMELVEDDGDEEIDSDLDEQNKPVFLVHDEDDEDAINVNPFEILDEDDIMLVDGFDQVRGLHSAQMLANVMDTSSSLRVRQRNDSNASVGSSRASPNTAANDLSKEWRKSAYIQASMEILTSQHSGSWLGLGLAILTPSAEQSLVQSICKIVKPPKKPLKLKVFMRRAPTQEEFFRGNISRNPVLISSIKRVQGTTSNDSSVTGSDKNEPRVRDLRQHIANDLQMGDSAELLELLVANKILDMDLKLRVVSQTLWKTHLTENATVTQAEPSGLRQIMSAGFDSGARLRIDENTPMSSLPPMVVTYRLAGVDGEATEDKVEVGDLVDPEAPPDVESSAVEFEKQMEKEFGLTRLTTKSRGVYMLLRSIETYLTEIMKKIRRDDVGRRRQHCVEVVTKNVSRERFLKSPPCSSLMLLRHCSRLADNRKKLIDAKAPTVLLRLMLEVLNSIDESSSVSSNSAIQLSSSNDIQSTKLHRIGSNPTTELLQELIETLASDISTTESTMEKPNNEAFFKNDTDEVEDYDESTLPMVLSSLTTTSLSPPLRKVIAKLLPFLTYGQISQVKALAQHFISHIDFACLSSQTDEVKEDNLDPKSVLMETFVDAAIHLPPVSVCNSLRSELIRQGFASNVQKFLLKDIPQTPPPWSAALFPKVPNEINNNMNKQNQQVKEDAWRNFYNRTGLQTGFNILIGLCKEHSETQSHVAKKSVDSTSVPFLTACHWLESTSDHSSSEISTNGLGILAETLLDVVAENNEECGKLVKQLRKVTRDRKKEMAKERQNQALVKMSAFGRLVGAGTHNVNNSVATENQNNISSVGGVFTALSNVFSSKSQQAKDSPNSNLELSKDSTNDKVDTNQQTKPSWLLEMEAMEDETGLTCAVCQEGRTLQPTELLGLYAFMKKVAIPSNKGGLKGSIDGALLLMSLPFSLPAPLRGTEVDREWFKPAKTAALALKSTSHGAQTLSAASSSILSSRPTYFITTVTAGNAIHSSCHARARTVDRNHPKAPKSEWEGASLRNSRVSCNVILPLASKKNSKVPVMSLENALADQQVAISNLLGTQPQSMLWTMLHDVRLLLLRIAYGESLSSDCGGGSLTSNCALIYYLLFIADLFARDAEADSPATVQHAKQLTPGFLAVSSILRSGEYKDDSVTSLRMCRSFADAAPMASICCMLFSHKRSEESSFNMDASKKTWELYKDHFLCALIRCAGRRFALGNDTSGCESNRGSLSGRSTRSSSFNEWDTTESSSMDFSSPSANLDDYTGALRPMLTFYAILDQISKDFFFNMDDEKVEESAGKIANIVGNCQKADNIKSILLMSTITLDEKKIVEEIIAGINTVK